ncbi:hypothetical protein [Mycobacteroides saopaulense]|uniref:Uncharacterized protein n=1 Tax=Mycobacteroides saopaulense TaxID=1578165 RepID=A0ABX3BZ55_9MYCO|nr:hypothetical protein [Mycobacteroides saopaulense]OHT81499.1 hypothetical protein BKG68_21345 [Mycobacteroides saopaulense]OHU09027.1 hypothetical protein BKG73_13305 [Mycobacteroides saopaulense]
MTEIYGLLGGVYAAGQQIIDADSKAHPHLWVWSNSQLSVLLRRVAYAGYPVVSNSVKAGSGLALARILVDHSTRIVVD